MEDVNYLDLLNRVLISLNINFKSNRILLSTIIVKPKYIPTLNKIKGSNLKINSKLEVSVN